MQDKNAAPIFNDSEASRLHFQHLHFSTILGELLPMAVSPPHIQAVLDALCGAGAWAIDLARAYPHIRVVGVDHNPELIGAAQGQVAHIPNAAFQLDDVRASLHFPNATFDFVRLLRGSTWVTITQWPAVLRTMLRVLRPGGWLNVLDFEPGPSSSPAVATYNRLLGKAMAMLGRGISIEGRAITPAVLYPRLLSQAGYVDVRYALYPVDLGTWNNPEMLHYKLSTLSNTQQLLDTLLQQGAITQPDLDELLQRVRTDIQQVDYCGMGMLISVVGRKRTNAPASRQAHS